MQVSPEQGALLGMMVELMDAKKVVEIGTYTGYSSISMALAMREGGVLYACDKSEESMEVARRYWKLAGVEKKIVEKIGDAKVSVLELLKEHGENSFDFGFIDADKRAYREYYETLLKLVRPGGLIIVDNVLWYGKVADPEVQDKQTVAIRDFNDFITSDERVTYTMVPVGDGLSFCRKR
jgi:predicted O-methyltransferase YrrM